eukprot:scaffold133701_cov30-Tisochrysis_lutea.AAC.2
MRRIAILQATTTKSKAISLTCHHVAYARCKVLGVVSAAQPAEDHALMASPCNRSTVNDSIHIQALQAKPQVAYKACHPNVHMRSVLSQEAVSALRVLPVAAAASSGLGLQGMLATPSAHVVPLPMGVMETGARSSPWPKIEMKSWIAVRAI